MDPTPTSDLTRVSLLSMLARFAHQPLVIWLIVAAIMTLGYQVMSPEQRIARVEAEHAAMREQINELRREQATTHGYMCVKTTREEQQMIPGLSDCVYATTKKVP